MGVAMDATSTANRQTQSEMQASSADEASARFCGANWSSAGHVGILSREGAVTRISRHGDGVWLQVEARRRYE